MELQEFVSQTLVEISQGVSQAQKRLSDSGAMISPQVVQSKAESTASVGYINTNYGMAQVVTFDVAVTVGDRSSAGGGIGVFSGAINLGGKGETSQENSPLSRVQFSVPVILPGGARERT